MKVDWKDSIYSDGSKHFVTNPKPKLGEKIKIKLRVLAESPVEDVILRCKINGNAHFFAMEKERVEGKFIYYSYRLELNQPDFNYHFIISTSEETYYYNQLELCNYPPVEDYDFRIIVDYQPPEWVKSAVFYQIFPDRFNNGNRDNDVQTNEYKFDGYSTIKKDWVDDPGEYEDTHCLDFFGGDLEGIQEKIPYLKDLGVNALYLNPIFYAATHHKYDCLDYFAVDPHFGGDRALIDLNQELHRNNMRVMLDISVNHTGTAHKWFNKEASFFAEDVGAYNNPDSRERDYYYFDEEGNYHGWEGVKTLPTLNYESEALRDIIYREPDSVLKYWLQEPFKIDAGRLDVADVMARMDENQMHHEVWPEIRASIREENSEAYILGEHWRDDREFLLGDEWDSSMNYFGFGRPVRQFVGELDHMLERHQDQFGFSSKKRTASELATQLKQKLARLPHQIAYVQFNLLDSHDISRLHNNSEISWSDYRGAVIMLFTFPGAPNIYYGDEVEIEGHAKSVEGCRYPMEWDPEEQNQNYYRLYKTLAQLKQEEEALQTGGFKILYQTDYVIAYARFVADEIYLTVVSQEDKRTEVEIPVGAVGVSEVAEVNELFGHQPAMKIESGVMQLELDAKDAFLFEISI
jgi:alpha-glucosidase